MSNERNWNRLFLRWGRRFRVRFSFFSVLLFNFFGIVGSVTPTFDKFQLRSQVRLSQINVVITIRLNFKLNAAFFEWAGRV